MLRLSLNRAVRRRRSDRGATATMVVILMASGVLLGAAALSVDVGSMMWERRQLQNGADAVALAMAQVCASGASGCSVSGAAAQAALNNANAADSLSALDNSMYANGICGHNVPGLPKCDAPTGELWDCPPITMSSAIPFVQAHTSTAGTGGTSVVASLFSSIWGNDGETIRACSRAAWGQPGAYKTSTPMIFSYCEFEQYTALNGNKPYDAPVGTSPGYGGGGQPAWPKKEHTLYLQDHGSETPCKFFGMHDVPGGFGYLKESGCATIVGTGNWARVDTGISAPCDLSAMRGTVINLPIFSCMYQSGSEPNFNPEVDPPATGCTSGSGANTWYYIKGWSKFYVSGYKLSGGSGPGQSMPSYVTGKVPCVGGDRCISGWFVSGQLQATTLAVPDPTSNFGTYVVLPVG